MWWRFWGIRYADLVSDLRAAHSAEIQWYREQMVRLEARVAYFQDALLAIQVGVPPQAAMTATPRAVQEMERRFAANPEFASAGGEVG